METTTGSSLDSDGEQEVVYDPVAGGTTEALSSAAPALLRAISADEHHSVIPGSPGSTRKSSAMVNQ